MDWLWFGTAACWSFKPRFSGQTRLPFGELHVSIGNFRKWLVPDAFALLNRPERSIRRILNTDRVRGFWYFFDLWLKWWRSGCSSRFSASRSRFHTPRKVRSTRRVFKTFCSATSVFVGNVNYVCMYERKAVNVCDLPSLLTLSTPNVMNTKHFLSSDTRFNSH